MLKKFLTAGLASMFAIGLFIATPLFAHEPHHSSGSDMDSGMMKDGGMMEQMTKMMGLCNKMMESTMDGTGGHDMKQPTTPPGEPKKKS